MGLIEIDELFTVLRWIEEYPSAIWIGVPSAENCVGDKSGVV